MSSKVAIITRTRNRISLLKRAVKSVQGQSFKDWQLVIVNDGGKAEELDEFIESLPKTLTGKTQVLHHKRAVGMQGASNAGIEASDSEYICIHDDDDQWAPDYLQSVVGFLEKEGKNSPYQGVICGTEEVLEHLDKAGRMVEVSRRPYIPLEEISLFRAGYENPFPPIAFCYRRTAWVELGGYDQAWDVIGDMDFNLRFLRRYEIGVINKVLAYYRIRQEGTKKQLANSVVAKRSWHKRLYNEYKNTLLRQADSPGSAALATSINSANYLVEAQWILHDLFHRSKESDAAIKTLSKAIAVDGYEDRFTTVREALAILVDHARNPEIRERLTSLAEGLVEAAEVRARFAARLEEQIKSLGLPGKADQFSTVREALNILLEAARDPQAGEALAALKGQLEDAAKVRAERVERSEKLAQALSSRLEEQIKSMGLPVEADRFTNIREALNEVIDLIRDPALRKRLEGIEKELGHAAVVRDNQAKRLEALIASVGLDDESPSLRQGADNLSEKLDSVKDQLEQSKRDQDGLKDQLEQSKRDQDGLKGQLELATRELDERLEGLEQRLAEQLAKPQVVKMGPFEFLIKNPREKEER